MYLKDTYYSYFESLCRFAEQLLNEFKFLKKSNYNRIMCHNMTLVAVVGQIHRLG